jgi:hypothetical protein
MLHVIVNATAQYRLTGCVPQEFCKLYDEFEHFMHMEPVCSNPLPWWMIRQRHEMKVQTVCSGRALFQLLRKETMLACSYKAEELEKSQITLLRDLVVVKQQAKAAEAVEQLRALFHDVSCFPALGGEPLLQVEAVNVIVARCKSAGKDEVKRALPYFDRQDDNAVSVLST